MSSKPVSPPPDEMTALMAGPVKVGKYEVRPWTVKRFALVYPVVKRLIETLAGQGLTWDNLEAFLADKLLDSLPLLLPEAPDLLAVTLDISRDEAEDLEISTAAALIVVIFSQNLAPLKNFSSLVPGKLAGTGNSTPSP